jgi:hypothetical protein
MKPPSSGPSAANLLEQNYEWAIQRAGYMTLEAPGPLSDDPLVNLTIPAN